MKVIAVDNHGRETVADVLIKENVGKDEAAYLAAKYNREQGPNPDFYAITVADNYRLSRGMEDLV